MFLEVEKWRIALESGDAMKPENRVSGFQERAGKATKATDPFVGTCFKIIGKQTQSRTNLLQGACDLAEVEAGVGLQVLEGCEPANP